MTKKNQTQFETTSPFVFFWPTIISFAIIYQARESSLLQQKVILLICAIISFAPSFFLFYNKKIQYNSNKIIVQNFFGTIMDLNIMDDLKIIEYQQSFFGKLFSYGTILLVDNNNNMYQYHFLKNPNLVFFAIEEHYEDNMIKINPDYIRKKNRKDTPKDKLDSFS